MKKCNSKIKNTCGSTNFSTCTIWEGEVNPQSELVESDCINQEQLDQDQYNQLEEIWNEIDLSALGEQCLDYVLEEGKIIVKNALLKYEEEICRLKEAVNELENRPLCDFPISDCDIDLSCLSLPCEQEIVTVSDLFNAIITRICD